MVATGYSALGYGGNNIPLAKPAGVIHSVWLGNAIFQEFYVTVNTGIDTGTPFPPGWGSDVLMHGDFTKGTLQAGNCGDFNCEYTSDILIKRREKGTFRWTTLFHRKINDDIDFQLFFYDRYARSNVLYEYALVRVYEREEREYIIRECYSEFDGYFIIGRGESLLSTAGAMTLSDPHRTGDWADNYKPVGNMADTNAGTGSEERLISYQIMPVQNVSRQFNSPRGFNAGLNRKYPSAIINSKARYQSGSITATVIQFDWPGCELDMEDGWRFRDAIGDFLYDGHPKVLKGFDNRAFAIIEVENGMSEQTGDYWLAPETTFSYQQIGNPMSAKQLRLAGLLDLDEEWCDPEEEEI